MAAPGAVVSALGRNRRTGRLSALGATSSEIKTLSRVASVSDNIARMTAFRLRASPGPAPRQDASQVRTVRVAEDRDGQRLDNFLLGQLKGAPRVADLQAGALRPGAGQRRPRQGRTQARGAATRSGSRRCVSSEPGDKAHAAEGAARRAGRGDRVRGRAPAGPEQAVGRGQPRRQRHQLRRHRDRCARCGRTRAAGTGAPPRPRHLRPAGRGQEALGADRTAGADARGRTARHRASATWRCWSGACPTA